MKCYFLFLPTEFSLHKAVVYTVLICSDIRLECKMHMHLQNKRELPWLNGSEMQGISVQENDVMPSPRILEQDFAIMTIALI